jgi:hypothetical protein
MYNVRLLALEPNIRMRWPAVSSRYLARTNCDAFLPPIGPPCSPPFRSARPAPRSARWPSNCGLSAEMDILDVIRQLSFHFAKTMPHIPHEYTTRRPETEQAYVALFNAI